MFLRVAITILCGVGLYAAIFMLNKGLRAARGELTEPSVVQTPRARVFGPPNALFGTGYYILLAIGVWAAWAFHVPGLLLVCVVAAAAAAALSLYLAYSLLFVTRMTCPYCWTSHVANWVLFGLVFVLFKISY
jgi:uncharacterized membrane protein